MLSPVPEPTADDDSNGKGKGKQGVLAPDELVQSRSRSKTHIEAEIKELGELKQDLALKARHPYLCAFSIINDASYR